MHKACPATSGLLSAKGAYYKRSPLGHCKSSNASMEEEVKLKQKFRKI